MKKNVILIGFDGYIGTALTQRLLMNGYSVYGIDNLLRRDWIKNEMKSKSAIPIMDVYGKIREFKKLGDFNYSIFDISTEYDMIKKVIENFQPDTSTIVNLGHHCSGPLSQKSREMANEALRNNILGTNNILWAIKEVKRDIHYITIGTTGEYDHYSNIDIAEGYFMVDYNGRQSKEMIYPRRPGSIYHSSKTASTYLIDFLTRTWGLKCTDIQQSIVFGIYTDEIDKTKIYTRLDSDEAGGTVLNRFCVQAILHEPLTIYGLGEHQRGFLSLNDSVQALMIAIENEAEEGKCQVWNQLSEWHSMNEIADMVIKVGQKIGLEITKENIPTPRNEYTGKHYYKYIIEKLAKLGYKPTRTIEEEIEYTLNLLNTVNYGYLEELRNVIKPNIKW